MKSITSEPPPSSLSPPTNRPSSDLRYPAIVLAAPERRARLFYYGWVILGVAMMGMFMSGPGQSYSMAAFIDPMLGDLGLMRSQYSMAYLMATLISGAALPFVGRLLDALGARVILPLFALLLGLACFWMAGVEGFLALCIGLTFVRSLGQGALTLVSTWMVGQWFERRRGLAMGLLGLGSTLSFMTFPASNHWLIDHQGWRGAWVVLALAVWGLLGVPALLLVRNRPEDLGLEPDRPTSWKRPGPSAERAPRPATTIQGWTAREACRTAAFWKVLSALATSAMVSTGLVFHQVSLLSERGVSQEAALGLLSVQAFFACVMSLLGGALADRIPPRRLLCASMIFMAVAIVLLMGVRNPWIALPYSILLGFHTGIQRSSGSLVLVSYFGRAHFGAVKGLAMAMVIGASALGPLPLAIAKDWLGYYDVALWMLLIFPVASALAVFSAHPPKRSGPTVAPV